MKKNTINSVIKKIESIKSFGDVPKYTANKKSNKIYVCANNGAFHYGDMDGQGGWATFIGEFTPEEAESFFKYEFKTAELNKS